MPQHLQIICAETERLPKPAEGSVEPEDLRQQAAELASSLTVIPKLRSSDFFARRDAVLKEMTPLFAEFDPSLASVSDDYRWVRDNARMLQRAARSTAEIPTMLHDKPQVRTANGEVVPRVVAIVENFLLATDYRFDQKSFASYVDAFQEIAPLEVDELWCFFPCLQLALLTEIAARIPRLLSHHDSNFGLGARIRCLHEIGQVSWTQLTEPLILIDRVLREDPAGAYASMDFESRERYWKAIQRMAVHSNCTEMDVALEALSLARESTHQACSDPRIAARRAHVGYYLVAEGAPRLHARVGYKAPPLQKVQMWLRRHANAYYIGGIQAVTLIMIAAALLAITGFSASPWLLALAAIALWLPASQAAVEIMNYVTSLVVPAQLLPKLDFSGGIPGDCLTLVTVPALLLNATQVCNLVDDLEVRFLGNRDRNLHFALLTDLPDSKPQASEDSPLLDLCAELIGRLNEKYKDQGRGSFLLLHRHRAYNPQERVWMGWERKRGKLLDLNNLLRREHDAFPVKVGDVSLLERVRFVITLDSDTELPRDSAHRMVGALAHPLNQAIVDAVKNIVTAGYAILQPRVGVSLFSAARSRIAKIYSGQTGVDIYTRAVSDVYQDLFGEAIFTGKGIYEVDPVHRVLRGRFPQNALLSHDLIEGAYARVGLASDIEIIDDYPSRYGALSRRKHRWLRGDWQVAEWLLPRVPVESGERVANPLNPVSRWKIFDNLRRSLVEPSAFILLLLGWLALPGSALRWTAAVLALFFAPAWMQAAVALVRAAMNWKYSEAREAVVGFISGNAHGFLRLTFLPHQTLLAIDAVFRVLVRRLITHRGLLEWETAAEAEMNHSRRGLVDLYLDWTPMVAVAAGVLMFLQRGAAVLPIVPILLLWAEGKLIALWLNRPPRVARYEMLEHDRVFLRKAALRTWRYFAEFSNQQHNWLIPDNVQVEPAAVAARTSPTNIGLLLNARQVACQFGYLTVPEFAFLTAKTLEVVQRLPKMRGHLFNWYSTETLAPLTPRFVSSADSGNLAASLWSLQQGCLEALRRPLFESSLLEGFLDVLHMADPQAASRRRARALKRTGAQDWFAELLEIAATCRESLNSRTNATDADAQWATHELIRRHEKIVAAVTAYCPWMLPEFASLREALATRNLVPLQQLPSYIEELEAALSSIIADGSPDQSADAVRLRLMLPEARKSAQALIAQVQALASRAGRQVYDMDFAFLLHSGRKLLSVGYEVEAQQLHTSCYDLLASEARLAAFVAIAKGDVPQETWFLLGRPHTLDGGRPVLQSWTGTMFEYLMPALWMRTYPNTLLDRARREAVRSHQEYAAHKHIPWGISESAHANRDAAGNYQYHAFGLPAIALHKEESDAVVVSPYSTMLALNVDPAAAIANLRRMAKDEWLAAYGFYEAADFTPALRSSARHGYELVRCWMAHHQGMSLVAAGNLLFDNPVQRWFHDNPRVQATELLLQEKPVSHVHSRESQRAPTVPGKVRRKAARNRRPEPGIATEAVA
jgi:hypothetical protein